jgi:hypothetical protein
VEHRVGQLGDQRLLLIVGRRADQLLVRPLGDLYTGLLGQHDDADQQAGRDDTEQQQRCRGVAGLRFPEGRHTVADGLDAGQRRRPRGERPGDEEHQREAQHVTVFGMHLEAGRFGA